MAAGSRRSGRRSWAGRRIGRRRWRRTRKRSPPAPRSSSTIRRPRPSFPASIETYRLKSYMAVPLVRQDRVIGVMNLDYCERVTPFQPWQVELATAIAGQLALSLENTRLFTEAQERLRETTTLLAVGRVLSQPAPVGEL